MFNNLVVEVNLSVKKYINLFIGGGNGCGIQYIR